MKVYCWENHGKSLNQQAMVEIGMKLLWSHIKNGIGMINQWILQYPMFKRTHVRLSYTLQISEFNS